MTPHAPLPPGGFVVLGVVGAIVGSFLNVCIHRLPLGLSVVRPRSACPRCGTQIKAVNNIPVLSWLLLRGRCADCREPISLRYPLVEAGNAALWVLAGVRFGYAAETLVMLPFASALVVLFFTDWDHQLLPDLVTLPLAVVGLALSAVNTRLDLLPEFLGAPTMMRRVIASLVGAALGWGVFFVLSVVWKRLFGREAMGGGDLKLMLGVGAFLGVGGVLLTIFVGSLTGSLVSLPFLLGGRWTLRRELPFGCFLAPAALWAALFGVEALGWYLGLLHGPR